MCYNMRVILDVATLRLCQFFKWHKTSTQMARIPYNKTKRNKSALPLETQIMITATRHPFVIANTFTKEESSAVRMLELVPSFEGNESYDVLISYHSSDKLYRYEVEDDSTAELWFSIMNNPEVCSLTSWGTLVNRARAHGDIVEV